MPADEDERHFLEERRNVLKQRLHMLELRKDRQGVNTPADVLLEIKTTKDELDLVEAKLLLSPISARVAATVTPADPLLAIAQLARTLTERLDAGVAEMLGKTQGLTDQVQFLARSHRAAEDWRTNITEDVRQLGAKFEKEQHGRKWGRRIQVFILTLCLLSLVVLALLAWSILR